MKRNRFLIVPPGRVEIQDASHVTLGAIKVTGNYRGVVARSQEEEVGT